MAGLAEMDPQIAAWLTEYRQANEVGDEAKMLEVKGKIEARKAKLIEETGNSGIGAPPVDE